jgi:HlyD family secretion protein
VSLRDQALVPAPHEGVLMTVSVREGAHLEAGGVIAHLDDTQRRLEHAMATNQRDAAVEKARDQSSVRHAEAAKFVAEAELQSAVAVNQRVAGTHSANDIRRLTLAARKASLLVDKTAAERRVAEIDARGRNVALALAHEQLQRCAVTSPLAGEVIEIFKHAGEWASAGEPVAHVVRLDTLRVEGFVNAADHSPSAVSDRAVRIVVNIGQGKSAEFSGQVVYVRPTLQAGEQYLVYADVKNRAENGHWLLRPGMLAEMHIETSPVAKKQLLSRFTHGSR